MLTERVGSSEICGFACSWNCNDRGVVMVMAMVMVVVAMVKEQERNNICPALLGG